MESIGIALLLITGSLLILSLSIFIFNKKSIYYRWIDVSEKIAAFDYWSKYDLNWAFRESFIEDLILKNSDNQELLQRLKFVKWSKLASIVLAALFFLEALLLKIFTDI
ncbi:hypothetical protein MKQ68_10795 [Chitinophaga horti]|uniref:Uncharacterized protein n=1 Tax=Chitinophaga horti TaxID=2920382 RepID=A0ABY6J7C4_9BACT|nr:hypothetical protein [Chitinophaga horti]UYQ95588.1 hypothetical protein MKQ68_10795 [Chitinophaga horti]